MTPDPILISADRPEERIEAAAVKACEAHFEERHVVFLPPCGEARQDAEWWADALGLIERPQRRAYGLGTGRPWPEQASRD